MPEVFLTGGTGFIGGAILDRLVAEGRTVRALSRSVGADAELRAHGAEPVRADLLDASGLAAAMAGCRVVYHVAGVNRLCVRDGGEMLRVNVDGSVAVVEAAAAAGVERVVYTSSAATIGEPQGVVGTESTVHRGWHLTRYERSKHAAEEAVLAAAGAAGVELVSVNPSSVQGPGRTGGTARILIAYLQGKLRFAVDTRMSLVYIDDCVAAHLLAERRGEAGERYIVSGVTTTVREALRTLQQVAPAPQKKRKAVGRRQRRKRVRFLPRGLARIAGGGVGAAYRALARQDAPICGESVRALLHGHDYDGSRIAEELGLSYTPAEEWLAATVEWYRSEGIIG